DRPRAPRSAFSEARSAPRGAARRARPRSAELRPPTVRPPGERSGKIPHRLAVRRFGGILHAMFGLTCSWYRSRLEAQASGRLEGRAAVGLSRHLGRCEACRRTVEAFARMRSL